MRRPPDICSQACNLYSFGGSPCYVHDRLSSQHTPCTDYAKVSVYADITLQESEFNIIDLSDDTKSVAYRMVDFLYRGDYWVGYPDHQVIDGDSGGEHHALLHAAMFAVADKYNIAALGDAAKDKFERSFNYMFPDLGGLMDVIEYVYSSTPDSNRGLRDSIVQQTQACGAKIMADPALNSRLEEIIASTPSFAMDLIHKSFLPASPKRCRTCNGETGNGTHCLDSYCGNNRNVGGLFGGNPTRNTQTPATAPFGMPPNDIHAATGPSNLFPYTLPIIDQP